LNRYDRRIKDLATAMVKHLKTSDSSWKGPFGWADVFVMKLRWSAKDWTTYSRNICIEFI
jgi:hypothetical protein